MIYICKYVYKYVGIFFELSSKGFWDINYRSLLFFNPGYDIQIDRKRWVLLIFIYGNSFVIWHKLFLSIKFLKIYLWSFLTGFLDVFPFPFYYSSKLIFIDFLLIPKNKPIIALSVCLFISLSLIIWMIRWRNKWKILIRVLSGSPLSKDFWW